MALDDYRSRTIRLFDLMLFYGLVLVAVQPSVTALCVSCFLAVLLCYLQYLLNRVWIAIPDIMLLSLTPIMLALSDMGVFLLILGGGLFVYHFITRQKKAPFVTLYLLCVSIFLLLRYFAYV